MGWKAMAVSLFRRETRKGDATEQLRLKNVAGRGKVAPGLAACG
jgi:hypothetical protein